MYFLWVAWIICMSLSLIQHSRFTLVYESESILLTQSTTLNKGSERTERQLQMNRLKFETLAKLPIIQRNIWTILQINKENMRDHNKQRVGLQNIRILTDYAQKSLQTWCIKKVDYNNQSRLGQMGIEKPRLGLSQAQGLNLENFDVLIMVCMYEPLIKAGLHCGP